MCIDDDSSAMKILGPPLRESKANWASASLGLELAPKICDQKFYCPYPRSNLKKGSA